METGLVHAVKADRRMPYSLNNCQIQPTIMWYSKRLLVTTRPLLRDGKISIYADQDYQKLHILPPLLNRAFKLQSVTKLVETVANRAHWQ